VNQQNALALEFYRAYPSDPRAVQLMLARWRNMTGLNASRAEKEMDDFLKETTDPKLKTDVMYQRTMMVINTARPDMTKASSYAEEFIKEHPGDERGAGLLTMLAMRSTDKEAQRALYERIIAGFPDSRSAKMASGNLRRLDAVGKPFEVAFTDVMTGKPISSKGLAGKVIVVDFWATWCGPCIAEMPKMKELYAKYKDQGVEFIGISLDQPGDGLDQLKKYVTENDIQWPQYYQGDGWNSDFSLSWGVNAIPSLFVVDADGNLFSTEARAKLDSVIDELVKKRDQKT
jgi:thiol-disulfide isomerase/thioredoxin